MSQPISKTSDDSLILGISVAVLAILVFALSLFVGSYISRQNKDLTEGIQGMKSQLAQSQQQSQQDDRGHHFVYDFVATRQSPNAPKDRLNAQRFSHRLLGRL